MILRPQTRTVSKLLSCRMRSANEERARLARRRNGAVQQLVVADNAFRAGLSAYSAANALAAAATPALATGALGRAPR